VDEDTADVSQVSRGDRPIAPGGLPGQAEDVDADLAAALQARIAELDAVAWNLPARRAQAFTSGDEGNGPED
jgi:hypothetical protein